MRNIQNFHMNTNGWADIGYNFCIGDPGQVYEGRGYGRHGAHAGLLKNIFKIFR
jgi:N-acetylmuramoyl-L-alanine amidase